MKNGKNLRMFVFLIALALLFSFLFPERKYKMPADEDYIENQVKQDGDGTNAILVVICIVIIIFFVCMIFQPADETDDLATMTVLSPVLGENVCF